MTALEIILQCFLLTVMVEGTFIGIAFRRRDYVYYSFLCNLLTNPLLNVILLLVTNILDVACYFPALIVLEATVVFVEAYVLRLLCGFVYKKALLVSLVMNALSFLTGLLVFSRV